MCGVELVQGCSPGGEGQGEPGWGVALELGRAGLVAPKLKGWRGPAQSEGRRARENKFTLETPLLSRRSKSPRGGRGTVKRPRP